MLNLIFLGGPGAGKGTVAQAAVKKYGLVQISTGDLFRFKSKEDSDEGRKIKELISKGEYIDDATTVALLKDRLSQNDVNNGFILDGFPRTLVQAQELDLLLNEIKKKLDAVINIEVSEEKVVERICGRLTCSKCGRIYNKFSEGMVPKVEGKCDDDGEDLIQRDDDTQEIVSQRFKKYVEKTFPLIDYYKNKELLISFDGNPPMKESVRRAFEIIDDILNKKNENIDE